FVLTSVDEGANWVKRSVSGVTSLTKVISFEGISDKFCIVGYKVSDKSTNIYKTIDGANNFTNVYHSYNYIRDISKGSTLGTGFAIGWQSMTILTTDYGESWIDIYTGFGNSMTVILSRRNTGIVVAEGEDSAFVTTNGGNSWFRNSPLHPFNAVIEDMAFVNPSDSSSLVACGGGGDIFRTTDLGVSWEYNQNTKGGSLTTVQFVDSVGITAGEDGTIFRSTDGGIKWTPVTSGTNNIIYSVYLTPSVYWAVGDFTILKSNDQGQTWSIVRTSSDELYQDVIFINGVCIVVGYISSY
ncbi:MAG: hypothetical protein HOP31_15515, partial [Ignavibacteria bacterium]|nr:hypothetical protein [Ignavibacteria bacterium]